MLGVNHSLYFPKMKTVDHKELTPPDRRRRGATLMIYRLDWAEQQCRLRHSLNAGWRQQLAGKATAKLKPALPIEESILTLADFRFSIDTEYKKEIRNQARQAMREWDAAGDLSFDTNIREQCLAPAIAHVRVAFELLADCLYDPKTNYFDRETCGTAGLVMMLAQFWFHQTGAGVALAHALQPVHPFHLKQCEQCQALVPMLKDRWGLSCPG
jgi:hypothetical protein